MVCFSSSALVLSKRYHLSFMSSNFNYLRFRKTMHHQTKNTQLSVIRSTFISNQIPYLKLKFDIAMRSIVCRSAEKRSMDSEPVPEWRLLSPPLDAHLFKCCVIEPRSTPAELLHRLKHVTLYVRDTGLQSGYRSYTHIRYRQQKFWIKLAGRVLLPMAQRSEQKNSLALRKKISTNKSKLRLVNNLLQIIFNESCTIFTLNLLPLFKLSAL